MFWNVRWAFFKTFHSQIHRMRDTPSKKVGQTQLICCFLNPVNRWWIFFVFKKIKFNKFPSFDTFSSNLWYVFPFIFYYLSQSTAMGLGKIQETTNQLSGLQYLQIHELEGFYVWSVANWECVLITSWQEYLVERNVLKVLLY